MIRLVDYLRNLESDDVEAAYITPKYLRQICPTDTAKYEEDELFDIITEVAQFGGEYAATSLEQKENQFASGSVFDTQTLDLTQLETTNREHLQDVIDSLSLIDFVRDFTEGEVDEITQQFWDFEEDFDNEK